MSRLRRLAPPVLALLLATALVIVVPSAAGAEGVVECHGHVATIIGTDGNDNGIGGNPPALVGTPGDDVIHGLGGRDIILGNGGNDIICGGGGGDVIDGGNGNDRIWGQGGNDKLKGGKGADVIRAGHHNDRVWGNGGNDTIWAGSGADTCIGEAEASCELDRRKGHDTEDWRDLVEQYWGDIGETENALIIIECESRGEPFAIGGSGDRYYGLFQHDIRDWERRAEGAGFAGESPLHPEANIAAARWYSDAWVEWKGGDTSTRWDAWSCKYRL